MTTAWIDIRNCKTDEIAEIIRAATEHQIEAVIANGDADKKIGTRQAGIQWVAFKEAGNGSGSESTGADICVHSYGGGASGLLASHLRHSNRGAKIMTFVSDLAEAKVVMSVLESGPDGVIMTPRSAAEVEALGRLCSPMRGHLELKEFSVTEIADAGTGDRVCVDTCSNFFPDEGLLVGSFGGGFLLCCSETHPLPYMPTRPFRVNAGAVSSYILSSLDRTNYLSELCQGDTVTAVKVNGDTRSLVIGRAKIETRPLLLIKARSADGDTASLMLQNDWHVRVLGRAGAVHNITELKAGSIILGFTAARARHVGMAVDEYCLEQ